MQSNAIRLDFRSDTVTRPTPQMRAAMAAAEVGDDVLGDDLTVKALETRVATMFGKEAGLLLPTGTMANLAAETRLIPTCGRLAAPPCSALFSRNLCRSASTVRSPSMIFTRWLRRTIHSSR